MAEELFVRRAEGRHEARSAGTRPAARVHPEVVDALADLGIDVRTKKPKGLQNRDAEWADVVVTMGCGDECPVLAGKRYVEWEIEDPAGKRPGEVANVRDEIARRVDALVAGL